MKTVPTRSFTKSIYCCLLAFGVLASYRLYAIDDKDDDGSKKKKETKTEAPFSLNNKSVKIYPDPIKKEMHVVSKEKTETTFFVFDLEGTLIVNRPLKESEHFKLSGLKRGFYTYHLFCGDEEKAYGKFEIR